MIDLETQMKINELIDSAYEQMKEIFNINEETPAKEKIYQTMAMVKGDLPSYFVLTLIITWGYSRVFLSHYV